MNTASARAYGKINLILHCGQPDERGYHPLISVFQAVNLVEDVQVTLTSSEKSSVRTTWMGQPEAAPAIDLDVEAEKHLAVRGALAVLEAAQRSGGGREYSTVAVEVIKRVPVAGGMAGGSADAAAAIIATNKLLPEPLAAEELHAIARTLGADVPFCLVGGNALGTGYADHIRTLPTGPQRHWVIALAKRGLATPEVFHELDVLGRGRTNLPQIAPQTILDLLDPDPKRLAQVMHNDLECAAFSLRPELRDTIAAAVDSGALAACVSGSGPTIAALAPSDTEAKRIAAQLSAVPEVAATVTCVGPATLEEI